MTRHSQATAIAAAGVCLLVVSACSSPAATTASQSPTEPVPSQSMTAAASPAASPGTGSEQAAGARISYAEYEQDPAKYSDSDVVLHFSAPWCPTCVATNESLEQDGVPAGLTVVTVDYDSSQDLKQRYGVTTQHTFVQIDESGQEKAKFTGSITGEEIQSNLV